MLEKSCHGYYLIQNIGKIIIWYAKHLNIPSCFSTYNGY